MHVLLRNHDTPDANTSISIAFITVILHNIFSIVMPAHLFGISFTILKKKFYPLQ